MTRFASLVLVVVLLLFLGQQGGAAPESLVDVFRQASPSIGALYSQSEDGDIVFNCTVTAVGRPGKATAVLTAFHCVKKGVAYLVSFDGKRFFGARVWKIPHYEIDQTKFPKKYGEPETDMAFFLIDEPTDVPLVPLGDDIGVEVGDRIITIGFPLGVTKTRYEGMVSGRLDKPGADLHGYLILQIFGAPGSSGSSVFSIRTRKIVGVLVAAQQASFGLPVIFATPISYSKNLREVDR